MRRSFLFLWFFTVSVVGLCSAGEIQFLGADGNLSDPANWDGGALPGADDVAVIDFASGMVTNQLSVSNTVTLGGLILTNFTGGALFPVGDGQLSLGAAGWHVFPPEREKYWMTLTLPIQIRENQVWDFHGANLKTDHAGMPVGTAALSIQNPRNAYFMKAFGYGGALQLQGTEDASTTFRFYESTLWAQSLSLWSRWSSRLELCDAGAFDFSALTSDHQIINQANFQILMTQGGTMALQEGDFLTITNQPLAIDSGTVRQTGGVILGGGSSSGVQVGYADYDALYEMTGGEIRASQLAVGHEGWSDEGVQKFLLREGTIQLTESVFVGKRRGGMHDTKELEVAGGTLSIAPSMNPNRGLHFGKMELYSWSEKGATSTSFYPNACLLTQSGGLISTPSVMLGMERPEGNLSYGLLGNANEQLWVKGGCFEVGAGGFVAGNTWTGTLGTENDSIYRMMWTGGTLAANAPFPSTLDLLFAGETNRVVIDTGDHAVGLIAPIYGDAKIEKRGEGSLKISDASQFSGVLDIAEGRVILQPLTQKGLVWRVEDLVNEYADAMGRAFPVWHERASSAVATNGYNGKIWQTPILVPHLFGAYPGLSFENGGYSISEDFNTTAGSTNWTAVVVFRTATKGFMPDGSTSWYQGAGLFGGDKPAVQSDWGLGISQGGKVFAGYGIAGISDRAFVSEQVVTDDVPHVAILTVVGKTMTLNVDGAITTHEMGSETVQSRVKTALFIGLLDSSLSNYFTGGIAEVRLIGDHALTDAEQNDLGYTLAQKYNATNALFTAPSEVVTTSPAALSTTEPAAIPDAVWSADSLQSVYADGANVSEWTSEDGTRTANLTAAIGYGYTPTVTLQAPTFVTNGMNGHPAVRFNGIHQTLAIPQEMSPISGVTNFTVAAVYKTTAKGRATKSYWYYGTGLLDCERGGDHQGDWGVAIGKDGRITAGIGPRDAGDQCILGKMLNANDGFPHSMIFSVDRTGSNMVIMVDGVAFKRTITGGPGCPPFVPARMLIGSMNCMYFFEGEISEIQLFGEQALSMAQMTQLHETLAAKYRIYPVSKTAKKESPSLGLGSREIRIAQNAALVLPVSETGELAFRAASDQSFSGAGAIEGTLGIQAGQTLAMTETLPTIERLQLDEGTGLRIDATPAEPVHVERLDLSGTNLFLVTTDELPSRCPFMQTAEDPVVAAGQHWEIRGTYPAGKIIYDETTKILSFVKNNGTILLLR